MAAPPRAKILLVDDLPSNLLVLRAVLEDTGQELVTARSGREALRRLLADDFALILLDVQMPGLDGFETAQLVRERDRSRHTPIIFLTAHESSDVSAFRGYSVGAVDYLIKPINPQVLRAKVGVFVDLFLKTEEVRRQADLLREADRREADRRVAEERARQDLRAAAEVQRRLYPAAPPAAPGLDVFGASFPAEVTGGDYFDYLPAGGGFGVAVGDVCGHGLGPALLMAATRAYLRALTLAHTRLDQLLALVNTALAADMAEHLFVTLLAGQVDPDRRAFRYSSAGHTPGVVLGPDGEVKAVLESTAPPLAVLPVGRFPEAQPVPLAPGDLIFLLTDGVVEAAGGPDGAQFGPDRAVDVVRRHRDRPARDIVHAVRDAVVDYCKPAAQADDLTAVVIKVTGDGPPG